MRRPAVLLAATFILCWTALLPVSAQTPSDTGFKTIASPLGYQFQVPEGWSQLPSGAVPRAFAAEVDSPGAGEMVLIIVNHAAISAADLPQMAQELPGLLSQAPKTSSLSGATVLQGPDSIELPNADAAEAVTMETTDAEGKTNILGFRFAIRGQTGYTIGLVATQDFYASDPDFGKILDSFQLTPPTLTPPTPDSGKPAPSQAPEVNGLSTITSPQGYQFQVPADWTLQSSDLTSRGDDALVNSADGDEQVQTAVGSDAGTTAADLPQLAQTDAGYVAPQVPGYGAGTVLQGPDQVQVVNADGAVTLTQAFTDGQGDSIVVTLLVALRGSTLYTLELFAPQNFYSADPAFQKILDSFQILPLPGQPAPING